MAIWLTALKVIPWGDVVSAAPTVARSARELWRTVRRSGDEGSALGDAGSLEPPPRDRLGELAARVEQLQARQEQLESEAAASAELMASLAEQNERLVQAVDILRVRTRLLVGACVLLAGVSAALAWALLG